MDKHLPPINSENPRKNDIFSKKKTKHGMDLRKYEKFEVKFAKTKRLPLY